MSSRTTRRRVRIEMDFDSSGAVRRASRLEDSYSRLVDRSNKWDRAVKRNRRSMFMWSRAANNMARGIGRLGRAMFSWRTLFVGFLGTEAVRFMKKHLIDYNNIIQQYQFGTATILNQMTDWKKSFGGVKDPAERFNISMDTSIMMVDALRKMAAQSIGTLDDYAKGYQLLAASVMGVGGSAGQTMRMLRLLLPLAKASGVDTSVAALDIRQLLRGESSLRHINIPALHPIAQDVAKAAREGRGDDAINMISEALQKNQVAVTEYSKTFEAQFETMVDHFRQFAGEIGKPIFNHLTREMLGFNRSWGATRAQLMESGKKLGENLVNWYEDGKRGLDEIIGKFRVFIGLIRTAIEAFIGFKLLGMGMWLGGAMGLRAPGKNSPLRSSISSLNPIGTAAVSHINPWGPVMARGQLGKVRYIKPGAKMAMGAVLGGGAKFLGVTGAIMVAIGLLSGRLEELKQKKGSLGEQARQVSKVMERLKAVLGRIAEASIFATGKLIGFVQGIGRFFAMMALPPGMRPPGAQRGEFGNPQIETAAKQLSGPINQFNASVESERRLVSQMQKSGMSKEEISKEIASLRSQAGVSSLMARGLDKTLGSLGVDVNAKGLAARRAAESSQIPGWIDQTGKLNERMAADYESRVSHSLSRVEEGSRKYEQAIQAREQKLAEQRANQHLGSKKPPVFDFSGSTFNLQQDFRDVDPDRIMVIFKEDLGEIAASSIQSRLTPRSMER